MLKRLSVLCNIPLAALILGASLAQASQDKAEEGAPGTAAATSAFYDGAGCTGWIFNMEPWDSWSWLWPDQNDRVSSIAVGGRTRVTIYEHIDYGGVSWTVDNWNAGAICVNVPAGMNNKTSSIKTWGI